jgi:hypothetical protein
VGEYGWARSTASQGFWHARWGFTWHEVGESGFTYVEQPLKLGELIERFNLGHTWELAILTEDYQTGIPLAGLLVAAGAGYTMDEIKNSDEASAFAGAKRQIRQLTGRRWKVVEVLGGGKLTKEDLDSLR